MEMSDTAFPEGITHMKVRIAAAAAAVVLLASACGSNAGSAASSAPSSSAPSSPAAEPATRSAAPGTTTSTKAKPLSFYASQYKDVTAPANADIAKINALPKTATVAQRQKVATAASAAITKANATLLADSWPNSQTTTDMRALVKADSVVAADLGNLAGATTLTSDLGKESAAVAIVHADLGIKS